MNRPPVPTQARLWRAFVAVVPSLLLWTAPAHALEEDAFSAGAGLGMALLHGAGSTGFGPAIEASGSHGLTDLWAVHVSLGFQSCRFAAGEGRAIDWKTGFSGFVGLRIAYDVLRVVPFAQLGVGVAGIDEGGPTAGTWLGPEGVLGAEYLIDRHWSLAPAARIRVMPVRLSGPDESRVLFGADVSVWVGRRF